jgi:hypothetical protein
MEHPNSSQAIERGHELIDHLTGFSGFTFNPGDLIAAGNYLRELGEALILRVLEQYCQRADQGASGSPDNALLVARVLYVPKDERHPLPRLALGAADLREPHDPSLFPIFPLHLVEGIPFLLIGGYVLGGEALPAMDYIAWCARHGSLRPGPLALTCDPVAAINRFLECGDWRRLDPIDYHYRMLRTQAARLAVTSIGG